MERSSAEGLFCAFFVFLSYLNLGSFCRQSEILMVLYDFLDELNILSPDI